MSMIMNHDMTAMMGQRIMQRNSLAMKRSLEKLSTGLRTKIADLDNTAYLAIGETMMSRIGGKEKALQNAQDGISLIQTASGALDQTQSMLQRMRELSVQAANDSLTQQDRSYIQVEINEIRDEISSLAANTQFNRKKILSGDNAVLWSSTNSQVKAVVHGGLRAIDDYGQKYAVDGNYKINVKANAGKSQIQKSDVFKIKHDDNIESKVLNTAKGVNDVSASGVPSGKYTIMTSDSPEPASEGILTGSYGIGGNVNSAETEIAFAEEIGAPVRKITVLTDDGVEIWSTSGSDLFGYVKNGGVTTAADQAAFFEGRTDVANGPAFIGVKDEVIAAAREKGIILSGFEEKDSESGALTLTASRVNGEAPGIKIAYETDAFGAAPVSSLTGTERTAIGADQVFAVEVSDQNLDNASVLFEVTNLNTRTNTVTLKATASKLSQDGIASTAVQDNIILTMGADGESPTTVNLGKLFGGDDDAPSVTITLGESGLSTIQKDAKFAYFVKAGAEQDGNDSPLQLDIRGINDSSDPDAWEKGPFNDQTVSYLLDGSKTGDAELKFRQFFVNSKNGHATQGTITLSTNSNFRNNDVGGEIDPSAEQIVASFKTGYVGEVANSATKLQDIDKFWTADGTFLLDHPQELTLTQGDGTQARVMIYGGDTVEDLTRKLNNAVANGLGQAKYVDDSGSFVSFVDGATPGVEGVEGTLVIRSVLAGKKGEITLSGSEELLNALSLNTIQESRETSYDVTISDAHDKAILAQNLKVTGNVIVGVIHENIDVELDPMLDLQASWNDSTKSFDLLNTGNDNGTDVILHLADNTAVFQSGDSEGDDVMVAIGDMGAHALGLDRVNVMSHESAAFSTTVIDAAIDRVSMQQAKLGSAQNRLEHHINNLTKETEMLTEATSHIRDVDYMTEIMNFTTQKILMDSNTAMLAQANQLHQSTIMTLMRI